MYVIIDLALCIYIGEARILVMLSVDAYYLWRKTIENYWLATPFFSMFLDMIETGTKGGNGVMMHRDIGMKKILH